MSAENIAFFHQNPNIFWSSDRKPVLYMKPEESGPLLNAMIANYPSVLGSLIGSEAVIAGAGMRFHSDVDEALAYSGKYSYKDLTEIKSARFHILKVSKAGDELDINVFARKTPALQLCHRTLYQAMRTVDANTITLRAYLAETQSEYKGSFYAFDSTGFVTGVAMEQEGTLFNANEYAIVYEHKTKRLASGHGHDHASWKLGSMNPRSMTILANNTEKEEEKVVSIVISDQQSIPSEEVLGVFAGKLLTAGLSLERKAVMVFKDHDLEFTLDELQNLGKGSKW